MVRSFLHGMVSRILQWLKIPLLTVEQNIEELRR